MATGATPISPKATRIALPLTTTKRSRSIPATPRLFYDRGGGDYAKREFDRAVADYSQAIARNPKYAAAFNNRGDAYVIKGDVDPAIADFSQAIALDPNNPVPLNDRGYAYALKGDYDRAIADLNQAIKLKPRYATAYFNKAVADHGRGDDEEAIADFTQVIAFEPKSAAAYNDRGYVRRAEGDDADAIADFNQAIASDPKNTLALVNRGITYYFDNDLPKALADIALANQINPKDAYIALWLDIVAQRDNLPSRLAQAAGAIDMSAWPAPIVRLYLGQLGPADAAAAADDPNAGKKRQKVCEANFYSAELILGRGAKDDAKRLFQLAASDCPNSTIEWAAVRGELKSLDKAP